MKNISPLNKKIIPPRWGEKSSLHEKNPPQWKIIPPSIKNNSPLNKKSARSEGVEAVIVLEGIVKRKVFFS